MSLSSSRMRSSGVPKKRLSGKERAETSKKRSSGKERASIPKKRLSGKAKERAAAVQQSPSERVVKEEPDYVVNEIELPGIVRITEMNYDPLRDALANLFAQGPQQRGETQEAPQRGEAQEEKLVSKEQVIKADEFLTLECPMCRQENRVSIKQPTLRGDNLADCSVCLDEQVEVFLPMCGHACVCWRCARAISRLPE